MTVIDQYPNANFTTPQWLNQQHLAASLLRLSTGLRINRGPDRGAGLPVSRKARTQARGTASAARKDGDGIALPDIQETNMRSAESAMRDLDSASEWTEFTRNQILTQSATAMLGQANRTPQQVLALLG